MESSQLSSQSLRRCRKSSGWQALLPAIGAPIQQPLPLHLHTSISAALAFSWLMTLVAAAQDKTVSGIAQTLQSAWLPGRPETARLIEAALILCADHELNVSTFTCRTVASSGASLYAVVTAGLSALQGPRHGGATSRLRPCGTKLNQQTAWAIPLLAGQAGRCNRRLRTRSLSRR